MAREFNCGTLDLLAGRFKALAEPMRLRIMNALRKREKTVTELVDELGAGQANISKHLSLLHRHRMVTRRKEGLNVYYRIADNTTFELCEIMCGSLEIEFEEKQQALKRS